MIQSTFLRNKILRQIKYNGSIFEFKKYALDSYGQKTDTVGETIVIEGIFHETISQVKALSETEGARVVSVPNSYILCLYEDANDIFLDDEVEINDEVYKVLNKVNVGNLNVAYDISLELIKNERNT